MVMTETAPTHFTTIEVSAPVPSEVDVGADIILKFKVSCLAGCDLRGLPVEVTGPDGVVTRSELASAEAKINETGEIVLKAPPRLGEHVWSVRFPLHDAAGVR